MIVAAIGSWFVNYGIAIAFFIAAILIFVACEKFVLIQRTRLQLPISIADKPIRGHWETFRLITYNGIGLALLLSVIFGQASYIFQTHGEKLADYAILMAHRWEPLSNEEQTNLEIALRSLPPQHSTIVCESSDCMDLAYSFLAVFDRVHWRASVESAMGGTRNPIEIESANPLSQKLIDAIASVTKGRIRIAFNERPKRGLPEIDNELELVIGRKP